MPPEAAAPATLIEVPHAVFGYARRPVVRVDNLRLESARSLGIFGPNGSGKTTLVRGLMGLLPPLEGNVLRLKPSLDIGYLPQHRALDPHWPMSGLDAASLAISARRLGPLGRDAARIKQAMQTVAVADLADKTFSSLSGGQQQRLLLAGALACDPTILILDEPTDGLDVRTRQALLEFLRTTLATGLSIVIISHDVEDILQACDQVAWLHPGETSDHPAIVEIIPPANLADRVTHIAKKAS